MGEPADFVVSPNKVGADVLAGPAAGAEIVQLNDIGQAFTSPAAGCDAAFAAVEDAVEIADLQDTLLRLGDDLIDAEGKGVKVEH